MGKTIIQKSCLAFAGLVMSGAVFAQATVSLGPEDGTTSNEVVVGATSATVAVSFDGDGAVNGYGGSWEYDPLLFGTPVPASPSATHPGALVGLCTVDVGTNTFSVAVSATTPLGDATDVCVFEIPILGTTGTGTYPLPVSATFPPSFSGGTGTFTPGEIIITEGVADVVLSYDPTGTLVFGGGTSGDTVAASIDVTAGGTIGTGTVTNCGITGANAGAFALTSGDLSITAGNSGSIDLTCDLANSDLTATLTCTETDSNSAGTDVSWTLDCGAGDPVPAPEYSSTPAPGSLITCNGAPGAVVNRSIVIENTGFVGDGSADSDLTFSCSVAGAGFALTGTTGDTLAVGESATVAIECTVPVTEGTTNTGSVTCTSDDAANSPAVYDLSSGIVTAPPPVPQAAVIPANSLWSLLALFGVLAGIGAVVIGLRRH